MRRGEPGGFTFRSDPVRSVCEERRLHSDRPHPSVPVPALLGFSSFQRRSQSVSGGVEKCASLGERCVQAQTHMDYLSFRFGGKRQGKKNLNTRARHPFCLESKLTVTDRPRADDRWPDSGGGVCVWMGWGREGGRKMAISH